jgi:hypothetical protein
MRALEFIKDYPMIVISNLAQIIGCIFLERNRDFYRFHINNFLTEETPPKPNNPFFNTLPYIYIFLLFIQYYCNYFLGVEMLDNIGEFFYLYEILIQLQSLKYHYFFILFLQNHNKMEEYHSNLLKAIICSSVMILKIIFTPSVHMVFPFMYSLKLSMFMANIIAFFFF